MNFNDVLSQRLTKIQNILGQKEKEYASGGDRFHNFRVAARIKNETPERALFGMWIKHLVSVIDIIDWIETCPEKITPELLDEKIGDNVNYLILLEGMIKERLDI